MFKRSRQNCSATKALNNILQKRNGHDVALKDNFDENVRLLKNVYHHCSDVVFRQFQTGDGVNASLIYINGLVDHELIGEFVLAPLMKSKAADVCNFIDKTLPVTQAKPVHTILECVDQISLGNPVLLIADERKGVSFALSKSEKRAIEEPKAESVVRGPREGFTETLQVNLSLLRRKMRSPLLKTQLLTVGVYTKTDVVLSYVEGIADSTLVEQLKSRLQSIKVDGILETSYIEEFIEAQPYSPFPQALATERPDVVIANLLEGRVAVLVNGSPFVLIVPITFFSLLQSPEDYYQRYIYSTTLRWLRYLFLMISILAPSLYVAVLSYHQEMIPSRLFYSVATSREGVPFPALVEALIMEISFEALREAGLRLPKQIGSAVSIVGALIIGEAAVQAGIVSAPMVIIVALTGIASFVIPNYSLGYSLRLLRFPIILMAGFLGLLGVAMSIIAIVIHLCTLRTFGVPYISQLDRKHMKDLLRRAPWWQMNTRPNLYESENVYRQSPNSDTDPSH